MRIFAPSFRCTAISLGIVLSLTACSQPAAPPAASKPAEQPAPASAATPAATAPSGNELNQAIQQPLDRARGVEESLKEQQEAERKRIEEQGG